MRISALYTYPVKGTAAVAVEAAATCPTGFVDDRRWMVVDAEMHFISQREERRLALVHTGVAGDCLELSAPGMPTLHVENARTGVPAAAIVWNDETAALRIDPVAAEWVSDFLGARAAIVYMPDDTRRQVDPVYSRDGDIVSFADAYPFLLTTQESLDGLNHRLERPVEMIRFRPNIVVLGALEPHAEDGWNRIRCGAVDFEVVKPCARCAVPTIDPATATIGTEPNRTLARYRRFNGKVYFGQNLIHTGAGRLRVGDPVEILETGPRTLPYS